MSTMSLSWICWKPRTDEPSKAWPSSNWPSSSTLAGIDTCCITPGQVAEAQVDELDPLRVDQLQHLVRGSLFHGGRP